MIYSDDGWFRSPKDWLLLLIAALFGVVNTYVILYPILHSAIADDVMVALAIITLLSTYIMSSFVSSYHKEKPPI